MWICSKLRVGITILLCAAPFAGCGDNIRPVDVDDPGDGTDDGTGDGTGGLDVDPGPGVDDGDDPVVEDGPRCTFGQGDWKNPSGPWPVTTLRLGSVAYGEAALMLIYDQPVATNGLIALAHQLITAKLNVALGAPYAAIATQIEAADALIGSLVVPPVGAGALEPAATSALGGQLEAFSTSMIFGAMCGQPPVCGNGLVEGEETCDDGNTDDGDGCSAMCTIVVADPCCGNGIVEAGEGCDDANTTSGDGCSSTCTVEVQK